MASQLGSDIDGEFSGGMTGFRVAKTNDGSRVFVSTHDHSSHHNVTAYDWNSSENKWEKVGNSIYGYYFGGVHGMGYALSCSSTGHRFATNTKLGCQVYEYDGTSWSKIGSDFSNTDAVYSVAMSSDGSHVVVGHSHLSPHQKGGVRVFEYDGSTWNQVGSDLTGNAFDELGHSVGISDDGTTIVAGAPKANLTGTQRGYVRVYKFVEADAEVSAHWVQNGNDITGTSDYHRFGWSCAMTSDGARIVIGSLSMGHVQVYDYIGSTGWVQVGGNLQGHSTEDQFGKSVSISSNGLRVAAGGRNHDIGGTDIGHVRVFDWDDTSSTWSQIADIVGESTDDHSGEAVALSGDGERLAIGASKANNSSGSESGHVRVFQLSGTPTQAQEPFFMAEGQGFGMVSGNGFILV